MISLALAGWPTSMHCAAIFYLVVAAAAICHPSILDDCRAKVFLDFL